MSQYLLGIDSGNTVCKATLFDTNGQAISTTFTQVPTLRPYAGHTERDPEQLWQRTAETIRKVLVRAAVKPEDVAAIGACGHGNGLYLLDKARRPLRCIQSVDTRAADICREWEAADLNRSVYPYTFQHFWPAQTNSLLTWLRQHEPNIYEGCSTVFLSKDYLNFRLTGEIATDYSDISVTNLFDNRLRRYDKTLLQLYGLEDISDRLPPVLHSTDLVGALSKTAARLTGLRPGTPVVTGLLDVNANMIGSGVTKPGQLSVIAGTWSVNSLLTSVPADGRDIAMTALFTDPSLYVKIEASPTSLTNLEWYIDRFFHTEKKAAKRSGLSVYELCEETMRRHVPSDPSVLYLPFLYGANRHVNASAGFFGLTGNHTKADLLRAVYEGIVCSHRMHIENLRITGAHFNNVRLTGGAARSAVFGQLFADSLNETIETPALAETGTWGAALTAGIGVGVYGSYHDIQTELKARYEPVPNQVEQNEITYQRYHSLIKCMASYWSANR